MAAAAIRSREVVALAVQLHGAKLGWPRAAELLGVSERTARALHAGTTTGATIPADRALAAAATLRRDRAAQLRAELAQLEDKLDGADAQRGGARVAVAR